MTMKILLHRKNFLIGSRRFLGRYNHGSTSLTCSPLVGSSTTTTTTSQRSIGSFGGLPIASENNTLHSSTRFGSSSSSVSNNSQMIYRFHRPQTPQRRTMSSDSEAKATLLDVLAREEAEEHELGNTTIPDELVALKSTIEESWRIVESGAVTEMYLIADDIKVQLSFHCQDTIEDDTELEEELQEGDDEDDEPSSPVRFTVTVTKAGKTITFACYTEFGLVKVDGVSTTHLSPQTVHETMGTLPKIEYQGPSYEELAEDLQSSFETFLEVDCGVTEDVAAFIAMYSDYIEELKYVSFLKEAQSILS